MYQEHYTTTDDGLEIYSRVYSALDPSGANLPLVCLPGLTRNSKDFHDIANHISRHPEQSRRVISIDFRGRGKSQWDKDAANYNIVREAHDVLAVLQALKIDKANFIGTSRGGLVLHIIATLKLDIMSSIIFNDIGPELELQGLLDIKHYLSKARWPKNWEDAAEIKKDMHSKAFPTLNDQDWMAMAKCIYVEKESKIIADFDPSVVSSLTSIDKSTEIPDLWDQFGLLSTIPALTIRGENSSLLTERITNRMDKIHPNHSTILVKNQGHPPLLTGNNIEQTITDFLRYSDNKKPE